MLRQALHQVRQVQRLNRLNAAAPLAPAADEWEHLRAVKMLLAMHDHDISIWGMVERHGATQVKRLLAVAASYQGRNASKRSDYPTDRELDAFEAELAAEAMNKAIREFANASR